MINQQMRLTSIGLATNSIVNDKGMTIVFAVYCEELYAMLDKVMLVLGIVKSFYFVP